jgi:hypothetical protein
MKLAVSFSGGRTSAFMARWLQLNVSDKYDLLYIFANTGCEHERTLEFIQECDEAWSMDIKWVEAVAHYGERKSCTHKYVDFESASRKGEPFEAVIAKYGIPNQAFPHCTRETKLNPIKSCMKELGFGKAWTAVGIRSDELDRMVEDRKDKRIVYPLIEWYPCDEDQIKEWWRSQPFDLDLARQYGNCVWCWKKSLRKHLTLLKENTEYYDFPKQMEKHYGWAGNRPTMVSTATFFRKGLSTFDLEKMSKEPFEPFHDNMIIQPGLFGPLDEAGGCSESCDIYAD